VGQQDLAALVHILGFLTGTMLFSILLALVVRQYRAETPARLLLLAAVIGVFWNVGALLVYGARDWGWGTPPPLFDAAVFSALGYLPAVVVHWVLSSEDGRRVGGRRLGWREAPRWMTALAYGGSTVAMVLHLRQGWLVGETPSGLALRLLTIWFAALTIALAIYARRSSVWKRMIWVVALSVFAVSALHLSRHIAGEEPWFVELIGHHASLPLVLAMLYRDYRFALADLFLKRVLALGVLLSVLLGLTFLLVTPHGLWREVWRGLPWPLMVGLLTIWFGLALTYPRLRKGVDWLVDVVILRREDYRQLKEDLGLIAAASEETEEILARVCQRLQRALTANDVTWEVEDLERAGETEGYGAWMLAPPAFPLVREAGRETLILLPTNDRPRYRLRVGELTGGRQFLSDDVALLESVAVSLARRLDAIRLMQERYAGSLREQEIRKLAAEAELRALRAQLNPHFLFNALTTIGYLIQTEPVRAVETLMRLTGVLRAVLRAPTGEMVTLGEELALLESYLAIERARFEERLRVSIEVAPELLEFRIPPLLLQPLVENAIKHGITPSLRGGEICVSASVVEEEQVARLHLVVRDSGVGVDVTHWENGGPVEVCAVGARQGVGLTNVRERLRGIYGESASWRFSSQVGVGTTAEMWVPITVSPVAGHTVESVRRGEGLA
jgi:two-component system LytT family sensor kinase